VLSGTFLVYAAAAADDDDDDDVASVLGASMSLPIPTMILMTTMTKTMMTKIRMIVDESNPMDQYAED